MKARMIPYGDKNICGARIEALRKKRKMKQTEMVSRMQLMGVDMNPSSYSKLEGQFRIATDMEILAITLPLFMTLEFDNKVEVKNFNILAIITYKCMQYIFILRLDSTYQFSSVQSLSHVQLFETP